MTEINMKGKEASAKEEAAYSTLQIVNEMLARGIEVLPVDLYRSAAKKFLVEDGKLRLPFSSPQRRRGGRRRQLGGSQK